MTLTYKSELVTIYCADARDKLPTLGNESVDCIVTDPPYGAGWQSNTRKDRFERIAGDQTVSQAVELLDAVTPDLVRVTRRTRHLYTFGLALTHPLLPPAAQAALVWDKGRIGSGDLSRAWGPSHESIHFHARAADKTNAERGAGGLTARLRRGSVIAVKRHSATQVKRHPTEKPVDLLAQLIESSTLRGELVLDPFGGVGSTAVAAVLTGRRAIVIELDPQYAEIAAQRVALAEAVMSKAVGL